MAMEYQDRDSMMMMPGARLAQNEPSQSADLTTSSDGLLAENDEPPDDRQQTPRPLLKFLATQSSSTTDPAFQKSNVPQNSRKQSLLTAMIHSSESENNDSDEQESRHRSFASSRGLSTASISTASTAELTSDGGLTSPPRTATPSPPLPAVRFPGLAPIFKNSFAPSQQSLAVRIQDSENIGPLQTVPVLSPLLVDEGEKKVEAGLGRKRCITFACGGKNTPKPTVSAEPPKKEVISAAAEAPKPKRVCALTFICPNRISSDAPDKKRAPVRRSPSPAPSALAKQSSPPRPASSHRGSDATLRNESPKSVRKSSSLMLRQRRWSVSSDICKREATRFHEFAGSADEVDEWTEEVTCYRNRITVNDTLNVENEMKRLAEEVEAEEEDEEDDEEEQDEDEDEDEDDELIDDEEDELVETRSLSYESESDDGFHSDNEEGFAASDNESDGDSAYRFWTPHRASTAATSIDLPMPSTLRPMTRGRSNSDSSMNSQPSISEQAYQKSRYSTATSKSRKIPREAVDDLPDSTDFVCGTLDEDRPKEMAYLEHLRQRKAAMHIPRPQDIDPTYPEDDPDMDEEDEVDEPEKPADESEGEAFFMHGHMDPHNDELDRRGRRGAPAPTDKRSPQHSPRRLRSPPPPLKRAFTGTRRSPPPPLKRTSTAHRSPPPKKLFGQSPRRMRSPPPNHIRYRSPPPTRRSSFQKLKRAATADSNVFASGRKLAFASSLPRRPSALCFGATIGLAGYENEPLTPTTAGVLPLEESHAQPRDIRVRGAIDIVKGLEKRRERRRMRLYEKQCRLAAQGVEPQKKKIAPGKGAEKMREVGLEIKAYRGRDPGRLIILPFVEECAVEDETIGLHMLSF